MSKANGRSIEGRWLVEEGKVIADQNCRVIEHLTTDHLIRIGEREGGWTTLYRDPTDGSYWELTYSHSEMHGGGPPLLTNLSEEDVVARYGRVPD